MRPLLVAIAAALVLGACGAEGPPRPASIGDPAPEYAAVDLDDRAVSLEALRGKTVLLNVWATWCPPCREEIPALQALYEEHASAGLEVVGVSVDAAGEGDAVRAFAEEFGVTYPIWLDPQERVSSVFRTTGVPTTVLIDREGTLVWRHLGPVEVDDPGLLAALESALSE